MEERSLMLLRGPELAWNEIRRILDNLPHLRLVGDTDQLDESLAIARHFQPEFIVAPTRWAGNPLLPILASSHLELSPRSKLILFATNVSPADLIGPVEAWLVGCLEWPLLSSEVLHHCLISMIWGDVVLGTREAIYAFAAAQRGITGTMPEVTARQRQILEGLSEGLTNAQLAERLALTLSTVKRHIATLEELLGAQDRFTLALRAVRAGLIH